MRALTLSHAGGMSLVEALVAVVVVAIGMMGVATLILESLRNGHLALQRTQAVNLVSDMEERIRANPGGGAAYHCASYLNGPSVRGCAPSADVPVGANCTSRELAEDDLARWQSAVRAALPPPATGACTADVVYTASAGSSEPAKYRVSVSWQQRGGLPPLAYQSELLVAGTASP